MRSSVAELAMVLVFASAGCARFEHDGAGTGTPVDLKLNWENGACKAHVNPDPVYVSKNRPRITWTVTDNCNQTNEEENETQLVFKYQAHTAKKWLDAEVPI